MAISSYNINPQPQQGQGAYGAVPGAIDVPPSYWDQLATNDPSLMGLNTAATGDIGSQLAGKVSPGTQGVLKDAAATWGVKSGMPGSAMGDDYFLRSLGLTSEGLQQQGLGNYNTAMNTAGHLQTDPNLAAGIASNNATMAAAPNPTMAANQQMADWATKFNATAGMGGSRSNPGSGTASGITPYTPTQPGTGSASTGGGGGGYTYGPPTQSNSDVINGTNRQPTGDGSGYTYDDNGDEYDASGRKTGLNIYSGQGPSGGTTPLAGGGSYYTPGLGITSWDPSNWSSDTLDVMGNPIDQSAAQPTTNWWDSQFDAQGNYIGGDDTGSGGDAYTGQDYNYDPNQYDFSSYA